MTTEKTTTTEATKPNRTMSVIQNAAMKRREALLARIKPLQEEVAQLDAILAAGKTNPEPPKES